MSLHNNMTNQRNSEMTRPHVVILGAGASRAACCNGDNNERKLPLMNDLIDVLELNHTFNKWNINQQQNFENIYSELYEKQEHDKLKVIERAVEDYFVQLCLPDVPTIYDHLVLSLTNKDLIASFNWDPLLLQAYVRNRKIWSYVTKTSLLAWKRCSWVLCENDRRYGPFGTHCPICNKPLKRMDLLYPTKTKNYTDNIFIRDFWKMFKDYYRNAFMTTIFGYSAPKSDTEARSAMREVFKIKTTNDFDQIAFVDIQEEEIVLDNWEYFIHTHHYDMDNDFYKSFLANHPRRTEKSYVAQYLAAEFIDNIPIPTNLDFPQLWNWFTDLETSNT